MDCMVGDTYSPYPAKCCAPVTCSDSCRPPCPPQDPQQEGSCARELSGAVTKYPRKQFKGGKVYFESLFQRF
jgi:hypothetical protein